jgi:hypothetical protein
MFGYKGSVWWKYIVGWTLAGAVFGLLARRRFDSSTPQEIAVRVGFFSAVGGLIGVYQWLMLDWKKSSEMAFWESWLITAFIVSGLSGFAEYMLEGRNILATLAVTILVFAAIMVIAVKDHKAWYGRK